MSVINPERCKSLNKEELAELLNLPLKVYGTLTYAGMSPDGEIVLYISKDNQFKLFEYVQKLRAMVDREVFLYIDEGDWKLNTSRDTETSNLMEEDASQAE